MIFRLNKKTCPTGSLLAVFSDVHIPHHDQGALALAVEACEASGVTHVVLPGDIIDCGPVSRHPAKKARDLLDVGTLLESVESGRWFLDWAVTRPCWYLGGNHEKWAEDHCDLDPGLRGAVEFPDLVRLDPRVAYADNSSELWVGNLCIEHGHGYFPTGNGGLHPAQRIKLLTPDQSTLVGHLHKKFFLNWTTKDRRGVPRTRCVIGNPHMSIEAKHREYAGKHPNWQQGFTLLRIWWEGENARFTPYQVEIHRNKRNRPVFELFGRVYQ